MLTSTVASAHGAQFLVSLHHHQTTIPRFFQCSHRKTNSPSAIQSFLQSSTWARSRRRRVRFRAEAPRMDGGAAQRTQDRAVGSPSTSFLSAFCPLLKFFGGGDPSQDRNQFLEVSTSSLSSLARFPWGSKSLITSENSVYSEVTQQPYLQLYEFEACPFCRRVREALTELDLSVEVYPCPKGSLRHRELVLRTGGKEHTPFTGWVPTLLRAGRGMTLWKKAGPLPPQMLELFSYENNAYARIVREALCELELPYILHNVGEGSAKNELLLKKCGLKEIPYLIDPNTGMQMVDYKNILSYLFRTYSTS